MLIVEGRMSNISILSLNISLIPSRVSSGGLHIRGKVDRWEEVKGVLEDMPGWMVSLSVRLLAS